jgi:signal transduction histidine kinase
VSWPFFSRGARLRRWLAEATARVLETAARGPDVVDVLQLWAREIAAAVHPTRAALFVAESARWLRILPESQSTNVPAVTDGALASALVANGPISAVAERPLLLARFGAPSGRRGVLVLWEERPGTARLKIGDADAIAAAIGRTLVTLRRAEVGREEAIASERSRWAAELHDGHLQTLASVKLHTEFCQSLDRQHRDFCDAFPVGSATRLETELARLHYVVSSAVREARQFLIEMRSPPVSTEQFLPWLRAYADDLGRETGLHIELREEGAGDLPQNQVEEATRLVRETLINVRKHARAENVRIVIAFTEHSTSIAVSDDGVGFDVRETMERLRESSRNGLIGVRYRAESIGGEMRLSSEPGKGTTLYFRFPKTGRRTMDAPRERAAAD